MPSTIQSFNRHSVPVVVFTIVAVAVLIFPPIVLGEVTSRTYAITAAVLILAVSSAFPYALLGVLGTLPLLYAGIASFAAPQPVANDPHPFSAGAALRHTVAGLLYVLGAAAVGGIGMGAQIGMGSGSTAMPVAFQPSFLYLGGATIAVAFVSLQLMRYGTPINKLDPYTVVGTVAHRLVIAPSPAVALWVFNGP